LKSSGRDRGGGYGEALVKALPQAFQIADRWHLMENASSSFLDAVRKSMRSIRVAIAAIMKLASIPIKEIVRRTGHSRKLVRQVIRGREDRCLPGSAEFARCAPAVAG
jgi:transposase